MLQTTPSPGHICHCAETNWQGQAGVGMLCKDLHQVTCSRGGCRHTLCILVPDPVEYIGWSPLDPLVNNFQAYSSQMQCSPSTKIRTVPDNERIQDQLIVGQCKSGIGQILNLWQCCRKLPDNLPLQPQEQVVSIKLRHLP